MKIHTYICCILETQKSFSLSNTPLTIISIIWPEAGDKYDFLVISIEHGGIVLFINMNE